VSARAETTRALTALLSIALGAALLASWSWLRWTDPQIDFGNELYLAWQLSEGKVLYGDLAHRNGPLSHYWNALLFSVFGVSLMTLVWANLAVLAGVCALAFAVLRRAAGERAATVGVLTLLGVFAFSQYVSVGNYNFVTPYHHFQTHGVLLGLAMILALLRAIESGSARAAACAGLCLGASLLTKAELAVPALVTAGLGVVLLARRGAGRRGRPIAWLLAAAPLPPLLAFAGLARALPAGEALAGVLGNFAHLGPGLAGDAFYRTGLGLDAPGAHLLRMLLASAVLAGVAGALVALDRALVRRGAPGWLGPVLAGLLFFAAVAWTPAGLWFAVPRTLPAVALAALVTAALRVRRPGDPARARGDCAALLWSAWSLALLGKILLLPRIHHYGFALALPATLLLVALLVGALPELARRAGGDGRFARLASVSLVAAAILGFLSVSNLRYVHKQSWVGPPGEAIRVEDPERARRGVRIGAVHERLAELMPEGATLLVYPEGALLNYWLRAENPSRYLLFLPTELDAFGREAVLADLRKAAPDFVAVLDRGHREFGVGPFGADPRNGREILRWLHDGYERVSQVGPPPFSGQAFGAEIWRRRPDTAADEAAP